MTVFQFHTLLDKSVAQGKVIAVDIQEMKPIDGANILDSSDFTSSEAQSAVLKLLQPAGMVARI
jgi:23S rRNA U2552 (ribose-2'-O)-methylase RlmE/FtsJ